VADLKDHHIIHDLQLFKAQDVLVDVGGNLFNAGEAGAYLDELVLHADGRVHIHPSTDGDADELDAGAQTGDAVI
jgi:hypothetical protein